jgi:L-alanine-DL-glutamate epimerase-like enolase superfamily enzyme
MKINRLETFVIGDGPNIDPDKGGIEPLAILRVHTDEGLTGLAEVFRMPPGVVTAASVHLAAYSPITPYIEFAPAEVFESPLRLALQEAGFPVSKGAIALPDQPGIGYTLPAEISRRFDCTRP